MPRSSADLHECYWCEHGLVHPPRVHVRLNTADRITHLLDLLADAPPPPEPIPPPK